MPTYTQAEPKSGGASHVPPGTYDIEVVKATEGVSNNNNEQIILDCEIVLPGGSRGPRVREYLAFTKGSGWKIDLVRAACGIAVVPGERVDVQPEHFEGAKATVEIGDKPGTKNPETKFNTIERWLLPDETGKASKAPAKLNKMSIPLGADDNLDEIPF